MRRVLKVTLLVVLLGLVRYGIGYPLERLFLADKIAAAMDASADYFNNQFTTLDWVVYYFYLFLKWFAVSAVYIKLHPVVHGSPLVRSLKVYGVMFIFFASVSAVYMSQYNHPRDFYIYKILDGLMIFTLLAFANARIYPHVFRDTSPRPSHGLHRGPYPPHSPTTPQGSLDPARHLHRPEPFLR